ILLNRDFLFGDYVKRSATDYEAGTIIGVSTKVDIRHCFTSDVGEETLESTEDDSSPGIPSPAWRRPRRIRTYSNGSGLLVSRRDLVKGIPEDDVKMDMDWEEGDC